MRSHAFCFAACLFLAVAGCAPNGGADDVGGASSGALLGLLCGNGEQELGEACDDGNTQGGDGCRADCLGAERCGDGLVDFDAGEECDDDGTQDGDGCDSNCTLTACGNGILVGEEACDDGNTQGGDGCSPVCRLEECGNGILDEGEACDDGNFDESDGCNQSCALEFCGDGVRQANEVCDDGNDKNNDGCDQNCTPTACGNGIPAGEEDCDDGNNKSGDGCDQNCALEFCGDGILNNNESEACDDGNLLAGDGCSPLCQVEPDCGNGLLQPLLGEECDDGNAFNSDGCSQACILEFCGDGVRQANEVCDDGNLLAGDCCDSFCNTESDCEAEPNNTGAEALLGQRIFSPDVTIQGVIFPVGDVDSFAFTLSATADVRLEVFTPQVGQCNEDLVIDLTAPDLVTRLAFDDDDGLGFCSLISPELDLGARRLPAGTYIARVADFQGNQIIDSYRLLLSVEALCGDGVVEGFETCDDGNLENGDQCSASCH